MENPDEGSYCLWGIILNPVLPLSLCGLLKCYLQNRDWVTDVENKLMATKGESGGVWREKKSEREREIYHKELAHTIIEAEKPKICNLQAGDLGEPVEGVVPIWAQSPLNKKSQWCEF